VGQRRSPYRGPRRSWDGADLDTDAAVITRVRAFPQQRPTRSARLSFAAGRVGLRWRQNRRSRRPRAAHIEAAAGVRSRWRLVSIWTTPRHPKRRLLLQRRPTRPARPSFRRRSSRAAPEAEPPIQMPLHSPYRAVGTKPGQRAHTLPFSPPRQHPTRSMRRRQSYDKIGMN